MSEEKNTPKAVEKIKKTGAAAAPSLFTLGNLACGFFSILSASQGQFAKAGWLILIAAVFDLFDGRIARMLGTESEFGVEMDSLADAVSFCTIACVYACFGVLRLAKFNTMAHAGEGSKKYFSGLPVPAPAAILASFAISYNIMQAGGHNLRLMPVFLPHIYNLVALGMIVMAILMVSTVPYAAFKSKRTESKKMSVWTMLLLVVVVVLLIRFPQDVIFIVMSAYVAFGMLAVLYRAFKGIKVEK